MNTTSRRIRKGIRLALLTTGVVLFVAACGIPQYTYLAPPVLGTVDRLNTLFSFDHDPLNDIDGFSGYDLYYKFYSDTTVAAFATDRTQIEDAGPGNITSTLANLGYLRVDEQGRTDSPTIAVNDTARVSAFKIDVQFRFASDVTRQAQVTSAPTELGNPILVRNQQIATFTQNKGFRQADILAADADVPDTFSGTTISLGIAVIATGVDYETFNTISSRAIVVYDTANDPLELQVE